MQLDSKERGFSFMKEGMLDMRMDLSSGVTAKEIVNTWSEFDLGELFRTQGEERRWKQAAKAIIHARRKKPIETTTELAEILSKAIKRSRRKLHPATLVFQALRIAVNRELFSLESVVKDAVHLLAPNGRIGVMSFHRLEDRIVKSLFRSFAKPIEKIVGMKRDCFFPMLRIINKKPLVPSLHERYKNRRSRSAKLRVAERI